MIESSKAFLELMRQRNEVASGLGQPPAGSLFDLNAIHRAAESDPFLSVYPLLGPVEFAVAMTGADGINDDDPLQVLAIFDGALAYVRRLDPRCIPPADSTPDAAMVGPAEIGDDPVLTGVNTCEEGAFALVGLTVRACEATGMEPGAYLDAVKARARELAAGMDPVKAESFYDRVRKVVEFVETNGTFGPVGPEHRFPPPDDFPDVGFH